MTLSSSPPASTRGGTRGTQAAVYLSASSHEGTLRAIAARVLESPLRDPERPLRIAASYAAAGGPMVERVSHSIAKLFGGAEVTRFSVEGETGPGLTTAAEARAILERADLVFISGGDPVEGARRLVQAGADAWLRDARARGTPSFGISAGAILLGAWWAAWPEAPPHDAAHDGGELVRCTGVVPNLVVDCHAEEDHWGELHLVRGMLEERHAADATTPLARLVGLPTGTGVVIGPDGAISAIEGSPFELPRLARPSSAAPSSAPPSSRPRSV
jgi:putative intracellular protease/amidase